MFVGLSMWSFEKEAFSGNMDIEDFIRYSSEHDYEAIELLDCFWRENKPAVSETVRLAKEEKLPIGCYAIANDFAQPDERARARQVEYVRQGIETAEKMGAPVLRVFGGTPKKGVTYEDALPWIVECFRACTDLAEGKGVTLAMENHGLLSGSWKQVMEIIRKVDSPNFCATLDFGNFLLVDESPLIAVRNLLPYVGHVHCKDFAGAPEDEDHVFSSLLGKRYCGCVPGEGQAEVDEILSLLKLRGYHGMVSIEYEGSEPCEKALPKCHDFVKKYL